MSLALRKKDYSFFINALNVQGRSGDPTQDEHRIEIQAGGRHQQSIKDVQVKKKQWVVEIAQFSVRTAQFSVQCKTRRA